MQPYSAASRDGRGVIRASRKSAIFAGGCPGHAITGGLMVAGIACALLGCGGGQVADANRARASGTVTFKGQPLPAGTVTFESTAGPLGTSARIREQGRFDTDRVPIGENRISIDTASIQYGNPAAYVAIPAKYADTAASELKVEIKPGDNDNVNFDLKP